MSFEELVGNAILGIDTLWGGDVLSASGTGRFIADSWFPTRLFRRRTPIQPPRAFGNRAACRRRHPTWRASAPTRRRGHSRRDSSSEE